MRSNTKKSTELCVNEVRDYINRAPARFEFNGFQIVWNTHSRLKWLADIARGTIHERINRRAGIVDVYEPWKTSPVMKSQSRHRINEFRKRGIRLANR